MSKNEVLELLQQDVEDIKGLINYNKYGLSKEKMRKLARGIFLNFKEHLEKFIQN